MSMNRWPTDALFGHAGNPLLVDLPYIEQPQGFRYAWTRCVHCGRRDDPAQSGHCIGCGAQRARNK